MKSLYFYLTVVDALSRDQLTLPTLPGVALRVSQLCQDADITVARLVREVAQDPAIAARLVRVANSAAYGGRTIENLPQVLARLGLQMTCTLVTRFAIEQLYTAKSPVLAQRLRESWARSLEVAALSSVLARRRPPLDPATAMLGGLLHEIGLLPLIRMADAHPELLDSMSGLDETLQKLKGRVGTHLLRAWNFPATLADVPLASAHPARRHDGPADYGDVVCVAVVQEQRVRTGLLARLMRPHVPAFDKLDLPSRFELAPEDEEQLAAERQLLAA